MNKISAIIPVFRESSFLERLLVDLLKDTYESKEIFVIIDEPTKMSLEIVKKFQDRVRFILNWERIGKITALNDAFRLTTGNILVFLDSDVQLHADGENFLKVLEKEIEGVDILDIKKSTFRSSFLEKLVYYEYLSSSLVSNFFSNMIGKTLGVNGAAFAIRREAFEQLGGFRRTLVDDFDLATRSFLENLSFKYTAEISVLIKPQSGWKSWYKQRKRWGIATGVWLREYYRQLAKILISKPQVMLPSLLLIMPSLFLIFSNILPTNFIYYNILSLVVVLQSRYSGFTLFPIFITTFGISFAKSFITTILTYAMLLGIYFLAARKLRYRFNPAEFLCYYLFYSPLSLLLNIIGIIKAATHRNEVDLDWKI